MCIDLIDLSPLISCQAVAAVGQGRLMALYDDLFGQFHQPVAQLLLTKNDLADVCFLEQKGDL